MKINNFDIYKKVFIIAELSANHAGDINIAKETIKKAKECGADAVKLQTYTADTITIDYIIFRQRQCFI
jgi:pseudaminic acid synthase